MKFSWKLVHIHIALGERQLDVVKLPFFFFGILITTQIYKNIAKKCTFTSDQKHPKVASFRTLKNPKNGVFLKAIFAPWYTEI